MEFAVIAFSHMPFSVFESSAATAIGLFGPGADAALAEVVGELVEVHVIRSVLHIIKAAKSQYEERHGA